MSSKMFPCVRSCPTRKVRASQPEVVHLLASAVTTLNQSTTAVLIVTLLIAIPNKDNSSISILNLGFVCFLEDEKKNMIMAAMNE